jgi:hypothetical protein
VDVHIVPSGARNPVSTGHEHGNGINIIPGTHTGNNTIDADVIPRDGSRPTHITIHVTVVDCGPPARAVRAGAAQPAATKEKLSPRRRK